MRPKRAQAANVLRDARTMLGLRQTEMALLLGMDSTQISRLENDHVELHTAVRQQTVERMLKHATPDRGRKVQKLILRGDLAAALLVALGGSDL